MGSYTLHLRLLFFPRRFVFSTRKLYLFIAKFFPNLYIYIKYILKAHESKERIASEAFFEKLLSDRREEVSSYQLLTLGTSLTLCKKVHLLPG